MAISYMAEKPLNQDGYGFATATITAIGDKIVCNGPFEYSYLSLKITGTFVATMTVKGGFDSDTMTTLATITASGTTFIDLPKSVDYIEIECTAFTSGSATVLARLKKKDLSVEDVTTAPTITGGVVGFEDSKIAFTKSEQGSGYELVKYFIASNLTHFRGFGTTTSTDPVLQASYDGGNTWETCIAAPSGLELINDITETSLGLIATYGSNGSGDGKYAYSTDKGKTWSALQTAYNNALSLVYRGEVDGRLYFVAMQNNPYTIFDIIYITALGGAYTLCNVPTVGDGTKKRIPGTVIKEGSKYICPGWIASETASDAVMVWSSNDGVTFAEDSTMTAGLIATAPNIDRVFTSSKIDGKYVLTGGSTTSMTARDIFAVVVSSFSPFVAEMVIKNPSGRTDKNTYTLYGVVKSEYSGRYGFAMGGNAGFAQIVYTDRPIAEWGIAPNSDFHVVKPSFAGTVTQVNSIMETATGRCLITTRGGTGDADVWYSDYFFCSYVNRDGKFREVASTGNVVAGDSKGTHTMYRNRLSAPHIGTVPTWADAVAIFVADPTYPVGTTIEILKVANNTGATPFDAVWDGSKLVPRDEIVVYKGSVISSPLSANTDTVLLSFQVPCSFMKAKSKLVINAIGSTSSSTSGLKSLKIKSDSTVIVARGNGSMTNQAFAMYATVNIDSGNTMALSASNSGWSEPGGPLATSLLLTSTAFTGDTIATIDIVANTSVASEVFTINMITMVVL